MVTAPVRGSSVICRAEAASSLSAAPCHEPQDERASRSPRGRRARHAACSGPGLEGTPRAGYRGCALRSLRCGAAQGGVAG